MYEPELTSRQKRLLAEFRKTPIVTVACKRANVGRATYYRWREESALFESEAEIAFAQGEDLVNDLAESQLIEMVKDKNFWAVRYWLSRHHRSYVGRAVAPLPFKRPRLRLLERKFW